MWLQEALMVANWCTAGRTHLKDDIQSYVQSSIHPKDYITDCWTLDTMVTVTKNKQPLVFSSVGRWLFKNSPDPPPQNASWFLLHRHQSHSICFQTFSDSQHWVAVQHLCLTAVCPTLVAFAHGNQQKLSWHWARSLSVLSKRPETRCGASVTQCPISPSSPSAAPTNTRPKTLKLDLQLMTEMSDCDGKC